MKVLVTGMAGLIGVNLAGHLAAKGVEVVGVDNFVPSYPVEIKRQNVASLKNNSRVEFIEGDINDRQFLATLTGKGITHVAHLAARAGVRNSTIEPGAYLQTNIIGTLNVLDFAKEIGAKKIVLASTSSVYGGNKVPYKEDMHISTPLSIYAASKIGMESLAYSYHRLHGLPIIQTRFFTAYGPGGRPDMAVYKFTERISGGIEIEVYGDGEAKRDFTYVTDICEGVYLALTSKEIYGVFNLGHSDARSVNELIALIEKHTGKKAKIRHVPKNPEDPDATLADISKARKVLGYNPKLSLEDGIPLFVEWFRKHKGNG